MPAFDEITQNLESMRTEVLAINPKHYPKKIKNIALRDQLISAQETIDHSVENFISFRPVLEQLPEIAGGKGASLGEFIRTGIPVPSGFVILANAFDYFLDKEGLFAEDPSLSLRDCPQSAPPVLQ